jgi:hypothetical protein
MLARALVVVFVCGYVIRRNKAKVGNSMTRDEIIQAIQALSDEQVELVGEWFSSFLDQGFSPGDDFWKPLTQEEKRQNAADALREYRKGQTISHEEIKREFDL